jgi:hypothetical protein
MESNRDASGVSFVDASARVELAYMTRQGGPKTLPAALW